MEMQTVGKGKTKAPSVDLSPFPTPDVTRETSTVVMELASRGKESAMTFPTVLMEKMNETSVL
jgi:hypothetical protein